MTSDTQKQSNENKPCYTKLFEQAVIMWLQACGNVDKVRE